MQIESLIRRKVGKTVVELGDTVYTFKATPPDPRHLCEVEDNDDIQTFLAIKEGYRIAKGAVTAQTKAATATADAAAKAAATVVLTVQQQGGKGGKWFVMNGSAPVSEGFSAKSDADAKMSALEKSSGE